MTGQNRVRNETLWKEIDVSSSVVRNLENRALWSYSHIEWTKDVPNNVLHWSSQVEDGRELRTKWKTHIKSITEDRPVEDGDKEKRLLRKP
jgi:hypothetical protein